MTQDTGRLNKTTHKSMVEDVPDQINDTCYIVGGGISLKGFDFNRLKNKTTICVNRAVFDVPQPTYFITVDYTFFNLINKFEQEFLLKCKTEKVFVADFCTGDLVKENGIIKDVRCNIIYDLQKYGINKTIIAKKETGIGYNFNSFCTGKNSGYCALQLAVLLGFEKIYLLGIDLTCSARDTHYHNKYRKIPSRFQNKLQLYFDHFKTGLEQIKQERTDITVYSCSSISRLNSLIEYKELEKV